MRPKTQNQAKVNGNVVTVRRTNCAKVDAFSSQTKGVVDTDVDENDGSGTQGDELDLRAAETELCGCSLLLASRNSVAFNIHFF